MITFTSKRAAINYCNGFVGFRVVVRVNAAMRKAGRYTRKARFGITTPATARKRRLKSIYSNREMRRMVRRIEREYAPVHYINIIG